MLPMPGAPSWSWSRFRASLKARLEGVDVRVCVAFWLFGLINNILYVLLLTAALDLVGPAIPKATILLTSIIPGLATKAIVPYFMHLVPYGMRIVIFAALSTSGMLAVSLSPASTSARSVSAKVAGIILANVSSGAGEVNFLSLTHFYPQALAAWGSGTGAAGLVGAGAYAVATNEMGFSSAGTLFASAILPGVMLLGFFLLLPRAPLSAARTRERERARLSQEEAEGSPHEDRETAGLLDQSGRVQPFSTEHSSIQSVLHSLRIKLLRSRSLVLPYMLPLFLVYAAEYTINSGVAPTLLFPLSSTPFEHFRAFYPTYAALYQTGVFISRSSLAFFRVRSLYVPSFLQVLNLVVLIAQALWDFIPSVWFVFAIVLWEGLLGGLVYVSTYAAVREEVHEEEREFSLGAVSVSDSAGILLAGFIGLVMETELCKWQVNHGRDWCKRL